MPQKLITQELMNKLAANAKASRDAIMNHGGSTPDHSPVLKLFAPDGAATWLLTEYYADTNELFGLCDLGMGCPEIGYVSLSELQKSRGPLGLKIERDRYFKARSTLSGYTSRARDAGHIVEHFKSNQ